MNHMATAHVRIRLWNMHAKSPPLPVLKALMNWDRINWFYCILRNVRRGDLSKAAELYAGLEQPQSQIAGDVNLDGFFKDFVLLQLHLNRFDFGCYCVSLEVTLCRQFTSVRQAQIDPMPLFQSNY